MDKKYEKPKDMATALDCAIRDAEGKKGGYVMNERNITYCNYMTNEDWKRFFDEMPISYKEQFKNSDGNEIEEHTYPPHMASFGSSSSFIYGLSHEIQSFCFEKKLDTHVGGDANLDGFLQRGSEYIYVEAKRREIYGDSHANEEISEAYLPVYKKIEKQCEAFSYTQADCNKKGCKKITFVINGKPVAHFDLKQVICHFLGITYDIAKHPMNDIKVKFLYLLYNPYKSQDSKGIEDKLNEKYKKRVLNRYTEVQEFIKANIDQGVFTSIFQAVLNYQIDNGIKINFEMKLVDQDNYKDEFNQVT